MARQRPTRAPGLVMGPCIVEIDRIVIRAVQYQLEVNRLKGNFGWVWPMWAGRPGLVMGLCIVEIDQFQYQFEVNRCINEEIIVKSNFGWVWSMWAGRPRIHRIIIRIVQYQLEVNRYRNEEIIVKAIVCGCGLFGRGAPGLVIGPCIVEIDRIVIREVQYQLEVNRCRNEECGLCGWGASVLVMGPCIIDRIVIREFQYQFEVNRLKGNFGWVWSMWAGRPRIDRIVIREVKYQFEVNRCRNEEVNFQGSSAYRRTDRRTDERRR
ncbi:hypothetical protein DPMN_024816 [Dreissena polymorpha]|uniref:Uncharacterized protein n=1 Tax=Dreissena polymorpha TaxID=45954 RepID=A0A9D4LNM3_DREPO|nr:hypothetical protein DPMN_024816 [Dreissena polymorpha]